MMLVLGLFLLVSTVLAGLVTIGHHGGVGRRRRRGRVARR